MSKIDDGWPAFPVNGPNGDHPGMSLRVWLSGKAMASLLVGDNSEGFIDPEWINPNTKRRVADDIAIRSIACADALIAALKAGGAL